MKRYILLLLLCLFAINIYAKNDLNFDKIFAKKKACFILYDLTADKTAFHYGDKQCAIRISPCSTFKIPLALMAFDQSIFKNENTLIKWDGISRDYPDWNKDQTPKTWLQYSTVWVSKWLTPQLGAVKIKQYLNNFHYGNKNIQEELIVFG